MRSIKLIKEKYLNQGFREDTIDFAIESVLEGSRREIILETLTADYRGLTENQASQILEDLYSANGGEFKKENRNGYLYGAVLLFVGLLGAGFLVGMIVTGEWRLKFVMLSVAATLFGFITGFTIIYKAARGRFREDDSPFENP